MTRKRNASIADFGFVDASIFGEEIEDAPRGPFADVRQPSGSERTQIVKCGRHEYEIRQRRSEDEVYGTRLGTSGKKFYRLSRHGQQLLIFDSATGEEIGQCPLSAIKIRESDLSAFEEQQQHQAKVQVSAQRREEAAERLRVRRLRGKRSGNPFADIEPHKGHWRVITAEQMRQHPDVLAEVYDLVQTAYAPIGGHLKIRAPEDLLLEVDYFDLVDVDDDPHADAALLGKHRRGVKHTALGHDDSKAAKRELLAHKHRKLQQPGQYAEVSGRIAEIMLSDHVPIVRDEKTVEAVLGKPVRWVGKVPEYPGINGWYERTIGGHTERKIMVGMPTANPRRSNPYVTGQLDRLQRELGKLRCPFATQMVQTRATFLHDELDALTITLIFDDTSGACDFQGCDDAVISIVDTVGLGEILDLDGTDISVKQTPRSRGIYFVRRGARYQPDRRASEIVVEWTIAKPQRAANPMERLARRLAAGRC